MAKRMQERDKLVEKALTAAMIGKPELAANHNERGEDLWPDWFMVSHHR